MVNFHQRLIFPDNVLVRPVVDEAVLLNLDTNIYYSLDPVGAHMLVVLKQYSSIEEAFDHLLNEYDVDPDVIRADLLELIDNLVQHGLVQIAKE